MLMLLPPKKDLGVDNGPSTLGARGWGPSSARPARVWTQNISCLRSRVGNAKSEPPLPPFPLPPCPWNKQNSRLVAELTFAIRSDKMPPSIAPREPPISGTQDTNNSRWEAGMPMSCHGELESVLQEPSMHHGKDSSQTCRHGHHRRRRVVVVVVYVTNTVVSGRIPMFHA